MYEPTSISCVSLNFRAVSCVKSEFFLCKLQESLDVSCQDPLAWPAGWHQGMADLTLHFYSLKVPACIQLEKKVLTLVQISLSSENTNISRSQLSHSLLLPQLHSSHLQWASSEFLFPQSRTTHVLLPELLSLSSPNLCLNLQASGTVLACEYFEVDCCKNFGEAFCVLWNWNQGCFLHDSVHSSSRALFLSFPSPLLLHSQSCAVHFLWSQPGRWEMQHLPELLCTWVLQCGELNECLFPLWGAQVGGAAIG